MAAAAIARLDSLGDRSPDAKSSCHRHVGESALNCGQLLTKIIVDQTM